MTVVTKMHLVAENIQPRIGARVLNSKQELLSGELSLDIRDLIEQRGVLVFPAANFDEAEQVAFTKTLGTFMPEMEAYKRGRIGMALS